jgi:hypothetical protein
MKRFVCLAFLPVVLFGLETVNLIKDHSFEMDSDVWQVYAGGDGDQDSAVANRHDPEKAYTGLCSASSDTRKYPGDCWVAYEDSALIIQGFSCSKIVEDLDSLTLNYSIIPAGGDFYRFLSAYIAVCLDSEKTSYWTPGYFLNSPYGSDPILTPPRRLLGLTEISADTSWYLLSEDIRADLERGGIPSDASVDSFFLMGWGGYIPPWYGQKIYWDDIRLMGYADYDGGLKEILSGDSVREDTPYTPEARIKNFGREDAPEFSVIAEIWEGETRVYYDSLPWSLAGDTEDTVSFADFTPTNAANHTLTVRTVMEPDESDEDDEMSKTLFGTGISEPVTHLAPITLQVRSLTHPLRVSYALPYGEQGTLTLYDATGRRIERMAVKGSGSIEFTSVLPSGVYIVKLDAETQSITKKAVVLK